MRALAIRSALFASAALFVAATPALAQDAAPAAEEAASNAAEAQDEGAAVSDTEIVVTARRRTETLQDVPIAVTAFTGEQLDRQGATDLSDLGDVTPNVTLEPSRGTNSTLTAFIRGVGQQDPVAGFEQGVGLYLDDVYLNRPQGALLEIFDVERVEILRGPQGTLYGRNTIGGAIKYVTRRLGPEAEVNIRANIGTDNRQDIIFSGSVPATDTLRFGAAFARLTQDGFGRNLTTGRDNYNRDVSAMRATAELLPSDAIFARITGDYTWDDSDPRGGHRLIAGLQSGAPVLGNVFDTRGALVTPEQSVRGGGISGLLEIDLADGLKLRSITAWRRDRSQTPIDFDALPAADVDVPAIYENEQYSQEVQLLVERGRLNGLVGAYYLDANANNIFDVVLGTTSPVALPGLTASTFGDVDTRTWAIFGDFSFDITEQFSLSLGGRYTRDRRQARVFRRNLLFGASPELGGTPVNGTFPPGRQLGAPTSDFTGEETFAKFTPRASLSFEPDANNTFYLSYSQGFKGGGFDPRGVSTAAPDLDADGVREASEIFDYFLFEPETVDSYELGYKSSLFDRRLNFALALFRADYRDVQVPGSVGAVINGIPTFVGVTTNAGKARFQGIELESTAVLARDFAGPRSRFSFSGTLGYIDAKYREFVTNVAFFNAQGGPAPTALPGPVDVADFRKIQNTPKWTASGTFDLAMNVAGNLLNANLSASHRSKTNQFELPSPFLDQPGYTLFDGNLTYEIGPFRVGLHGRNLTDERYITSGYQFLNVNPVTGQPILSAAPFLAGGVPNPAFNVPGNAPSLGREGVVTAFYGRPREAWISLGFRF